MRILREASIAVNSGFHSPIEKDCLDILLKGTLPIVVCPARSIARMRIPAPWITLIDTGRMLVLSPFDENQKRPTITTANQRNHLVAKLGGKFLVPFAEAENKTAQLARDIIRSGKPVYTLTSEKNLSLIQRGAKAIGTTTKEILDIMPVCKSKQKVDIKFNNQ
jgi:hypothetical protein